MEKIISSLANLLTLKSLKFHNYTTEQKAYYTYGLQILLFNIFSIVTPLLISLILGNFGKTLVVMISFGALRIISGGIHFNSCTKCYLCTTLIIMFGSIVIPILFTPNLYLIIFVFIPLIIFHGKFSPTESPQRTMTISEKYMYKWISILLITLFFILSIILPSISNLLIYSSCIQALTALPLFSNIHNN